jgi:hypothetical protein
MLRLWGQLLGGPTLGPWQGMEVNKAYFSAAELGRRRMMSGYGLHMFLEENDAMIPVFSQVVTSGQETLLK